MTGIIQLNNIKLYAYHGCMPEETVIGSEYIVNIAVKTDFSKAVQSDALEDTIDYVQLNTIVKEEMQIPSKLLEYVANRILKRFKKEVQGLQYARVELSKLNPPINGNVENVTVILEEILTPLS